MAQSLSIIQRFVKNVYCQRQWQNLALLTQTSRGLASKTPPSSKVEPEQTGEEKKEGWFNFFSRRVDPVHESHSKILSDKDTVYELQFHGLKSENMEAYLAETKKFVKLLDEKKTGAELVGSWTVDIGDQDEAIHIWKYPGGYPTLNRSREIYRKDPEFVAFRKIRNKMLRSRKNQILLEFAYWGGITQREGTNIYELRSYVLKPGSMFEWGNYWAKGITYRREQHEATAGFFTHIGDLYVVHHLWAYESLQMRQHLRDLVWEKPGWDECVSHTVPLIRTMQSRILIPTPFSPLQ